MYCDKKENDSVDFQVAFQTKVQDDSWLWHFRFGHLNFGGLNLLHTKNMVKGFPLIDKPNRVCECFIFGKKHRKTFWSENHTEHTHHLRLCTLIFVAQCRHHSWVAAIIFLLLLMTTQEKHGYIL